MDLDHYPSDVRQDIQHWRGAAKTDIAYGWTKRVSKEERLSLIIAARLLENLIETMRQEIS
jgi:hypothetical protein